MEYEYSFSVTSIDEYLKYCRKNKYKLVSKIKQTRTIYRNKNKTMARITIEEGKRTVKKLDFKEDKLTNQDLNIRKESASMSFKNIDEIENILNFLEYEKDNTLIRVRRIYEKDNVKFEIDEYQYPNSNFVVAIEGDKKQTDLVYKGLSEINAMYKKQE